MAEEAPKSNTPATSSPSELLSSAKVKVTEASRDVTNAVKAYGKPDGDSGVGHYVGKAEDYLHKLHSPSHQPKAEFATAPPIELVQNKAESAPAPPAAKVVENKAESAPAPPPKVVENKGESTPAPPAEVVENKVESAPPTEGAKNKDEDEDETAAVVGGGGGIGGLMNKAKGLFK
ncbi:hypothetical protein SOVF_166740 [Spinacia oleracea]|uniref:Uncharacterized protein n=1 Tax=Spinacia oleracea TaxID=3562 RepID=A0A9R0JXT0_SPIOL|nr:uncharacterized protein LOC110790005 [Spinacia oleracea]KNA07987.1 hypothetical protein SOVF_166740 [Spinacia oleracea]